MTGAMMRARSAAKGAALVSIVAALGAGLAIAQTRSTPAGPLQLRIEDQVREQAQQFDIDELRRRGARADALSVGGDGEAGCAGSEVWIPFEGDRTDLDDPSGAELDAIFTRSQECGDVFSVMIVGIEDGGAADPARSIARAEAVRSLAAERYGLDPDRIGLEVSDAPPAFLDDSDGAQGVQLLFRSAQAAPAPPDPDPVRTDGYAIGFNAPETGQVGAPMNVLLVIDATENPNPTSLFDALSTPGAIMEEWIRAAPRYRASLAGANFEVTRPSDEPAERDVQPGDRVTWLWSVTPLRPGTHDLLLQITAFSEDGGSGDFDPLVRPIVVMVAPAPEDGSIFDMVSGALSWTNGVIAALVGILGGLLLFRSNLRKLLGGKDGEGEG